MELRPDADRSRDHCAERQRWNERAQSEADLERTNHPP
jgi:hypothetical protein